MRKVTVVGLVLIAAGLLSGCTTPPIDWGATPAYSSRERGRLTFRNAYNEGSQINDDIDSALLLRPQGKLTIWHVR